MEKVLILGAGPQARIIPDVIACCGDLELLGFVDMANERHFLEGDAAGFPVHDKTQFPRGICTQLGKFSVLIATDQMKLRNTLIGQVKQAALPLTSIIHPSGIISRSAHIGKGNLFLAGIVIGPGASIGDHVVLNNAVTVDHDTTLQDNIIIAPGVHLAGKVKVKEDTFIGIGACCIPGVTIGTGCLIAAGSVVTQDIPDGVLAAGVPAKVIRSLV
jgi:sugar O-acyltransferase (sialic acid O-acetyltransferase NeuD family)